MVQSTGISGRAASGAARQRTKHPLSVLVKPTSSRCNLNCGYCFYLSKSELYPWRDHPRLSAETFEAFFEQYVPLSAPYLSIMWQGGEPTMMGLPFFEEIVEMQARIIRKTNPVSPPPVSNSIQTNATMLNDDWAGFFKRTDFLVGVSLDGPPEWHDRYRVDWLNRSSYDKVMGGIESLRSRDVPFNILTVVSQANVEHPRELLLWLVEQGFLHLQFIPCVELQPGYHSAEDGELTEESITPDQYGRFLVGLFETWMEVGADKVRIRGFDNLLQMLWGFPSEVCQLARTCGYVVLEHNGDCYPCDFFVEEDRRLGNIESTTLREMVESTAFKDFSSAKAKLHPDCLECPWLSLCYGECPKYRITNVGRAENSLPYFCSSYKQFFGHEYSRMEQEAVRLARPMGLAVPSGSMPAGERTRTTAVPVALVQEQARKDNVGRNDPCPCGSGRKFKRCCGAG